MSIPSPFEVVPHGPAFRWRIIAGCGRTLAYDGIDYPTDIAAAAAAKAARATYLEAEPADECLMGRGLFLGGGL